MGRIFTLPEEKVKRIREEHRSLARKARRATLAANKAAAVVEAQKAPTATPSGTSSSPANTHSFAVLATTSDSSMDVDVGSGGPIAPTLQL